MKTARAAALAFPALLAACGTSDPAPTPSPTPDLRSDKIRVTNPAVSGADAAQLAADNLAFAVDVHKRLRAQETGNFIFSQTSISTALAMLYAGAATTTAAEMASTLHFSLPAERLHAAFNALDLALTTPPAGGDAAAFRLKLANSSWVQDGFNVLPTYLDALAVNYGAGLFQKDFTTQAEAARVDINGWVSDQTEAQIPELFPQGSITTHDAAGARQRGVLPRRLEEAVQSQQPERALPRAWRRRLRADDGRQRQRAAVERRRLRRRVGRVRR